MTEFRHIEEFRGIYPNEKYPTEEIFVIGSGPSLEDFPEDFFKDKVSIAVNYAIFGFPYITHFLSIHKGPFREVIKEKPHLLKDFRSICAYTMNPNDKARHLYEDRPFCGPFSYLGDWGTEVIYLRFKHRMVRNKEEFAENALNILGQGKGQESLYCLARGTTVHMAIQAAIILGAKKVTLIGCDGRGKGTAMHSYRNEMKNYYGKLDEINIPSPEWLSGVHSTWQEKQEGWQWLAQVFKPLGILIRKYHYKDGEYYNRGYEELY